MTVSCVLLGPALFLLTVSSESPSVASGGALPGPRKRSLGFLRPEIVFAAIFYKRFYKAFGTRPFSRNLASPVQVSPDGLGSFILSTVPCVLLVPALLLLTVSYGIECFASPIALFTDSFVRFACPGAALLTVSSGIVCFASPIALFIDSLERFASADAAFADSLVRNRMFWVSDRSFH